MFFLNIKRYILVVDDLDETYEKEIEVPVTLVDIPKNVVLTSDTTTDIRVTVRDKGYYLLTYLYSNKIHPIKVKFNSYAKKHRYRNRSFC